MKVQKGWARKVGMWAFGRFLMREYPFVENYFLSQAMEVNKVVDIPVSYLGGVASSNAVKEAMENDFELISVGRALIHDPYFVQKVKSSKHVSPCNHCNECLAEMDKNGVKCVL